MGMYRARRRARTRRSSETGARTGVEVTIARPTGIYGPGDRRLLRLFRGVARKRWVTLGSGEIYYHLTFIDDLVDGLRLCGVHPAAANRTYILAGGEVTTLNALVRLVAEGAGVAVPGGGCDLRSGVRAAGDRAADPSPARRFFHEEPRVRHRTRANRNR